MVLFGGGGGTSDRNESFEEFLSKDYEKFKSRAQFYGYQPSNGVASNELVGLTVKGEVPWWVVYGPKIMDGYMARFEERLQKWGVLDNVNLKEDNVVRERIERPLPALPALKDIPKIHPEALSGGLPPAPPSPPPSGVGGGAPQTGDQK